MTTIRLGIYTFFIAVARSYEEGLAPSKSRIMKAWESSDSNVDDLAQQPFACLILDRIASLRIA